MNDDKNQRVKTRWFFTYKEPGLYFGYSPGCEYTDYNWAMLRATWTPLAEAWDREWVMPLPSPMM